ncbi:GNAT family N-acetyltransferase [Corynebacterium sp.]|uniref:GNAT family N-acetyltransferase n=1 Tax=Corynebacterium sp. TaxID=1720 RepID=UPI003B3A1235
MTDKTDRTDKTGVPVTVRLVDEGGAYGIYLDGSGTPAGTTYFLDGNDSNDGNDNGGAGDRIFFHTTVGDDYAGRGLAGILVDEALADTRSQGRTVVPVCPYVRSWTEKHHWDGQLRMPDGRDLAAVRAHTAGGDR